MSEPAAGESFRHTRLGLLARRRRWGIGSDEPDAPLLWPGARGIVSQWLAGERAYVVATLAGDGRIAARALFSRSLVRRDLWHYGYLLTYPEFRRRGLGMALMRLGLRIAQEQGGRRSACYVAETNTPSRGLNEDLGYRALPYVRLHFPAPEGAPGAGLGWHAVSATDLRRIPEARPLLEALVPGEGIEVAAEEMLVRRPLLPWKQPASALLRIDQEGALLGFARRGREVANVVLREGLSGESLAEALASVGSLMWRCCGIRHIFAFLPRATVESAVTEVPLVFDRVYWSESLTP